jgi:hypothetical protein
MTPIYVSINSVLVFWPCPAWLLKFLGNLFFPGFWPIRGTATQMLHFFGFWTQTHVWWLVLILRGCAKRKWRKQHSNLASYQNTLEFRWIVKSKILFVCVVLRIEPRVTGSMLIYCSLPLSYTPRTQIGVSNSLAFHSITMWRALFLAREWHISLKKSHLDWVEFCTSHAGLPSVNTYFQTAVDTGFANKVMPSDSSTGPANIYW